MFTFLVLVAILSLSPINIRAQVVSHELRRLAVSSNQFGIDALRALNRIEPPDKVIVFCPICLSSSLAMIMMGSSKNQVVSSLRHALYVWSMKPEEINKGYRDIFHHIGLNQMMKQTDKPSQKSRSYSYSTRSPSNYIIDFNARLSLPQLIKLLDRHEEYNYSTQSRSERSSPNKISYSSMKLSEFEQSNNRLHDLSQMSSVTNVYMQRGLTMNYNYNLMLRKFYQTVVHPVDFLRNSEETRQHINSLVSSSTEGKIRDIVKKSAFTSSSKIVIVSAFHFRGTLDIRLADINESSPIVGELNSRNISGTESRRNFVRHQIEGEKKAGLKQKVYIETQKALLKHGEISDLDCSVLEIPFNNRLVSLIIMMPNHSNTTDLLLTRLSAKVLTDIVSSLTVKKISVAIPVIKFDRGPVNVEGLLKELDLDGLFFADKPHILENGLNKWMRPSDIIHETSIDIGTFNPRWDQLEDRLKIGAHEFKRAPKSLVNYDLKNSDNHIKLDKPFLYFVFDSMNGLILTIGRIRD